MQKTSIKLWGLSLLLCGISSSATYYSQICQANRVVELVRNASSGLYEYQDANATNDVDSNSKSLFRECNCPRPIYHSDFVCPVDAKVCGIPVDVQEPILCFKDDASIMVVRNIWPLVCLWYLCFVIFLCCSFKGRHAITYCIQQCFPSTNNILVIRMLQHRQLQQQQIWNFWTEDNPTNAPPTTPSELVLKTKQYHEINGDQTNTDDEDDPATCCTICFVELEEGDRIGDLSCDHIYHVDCLKGWVQRKNTCPLCAAPMATPRKPPNEASNNV